MNYANDLIDSWYTASAGTPRNFAALEGDHDTDVCVIGGGYTGLSTALHLRKRGYRVILLEANRLGWGASGRNGGHVGTGQRVDQATLEKWMGLNTAKDLWRLGLDAVQLVESLVEELGIECELGQGNLHLAAKAGHAEELAEEVNHLRDRYGYEQISYIEQDDLSAHTSAQGFYGASLDRGARHLHPYKYALGLAKGVADAGAEVYESTPALAVHGKRVKTPQGTVTAKRIVMACNGYLGKLAPKLASNIMPINNFMIATEPLSEDICRQLSGDNTSLSDTLFVINYWKLSADGRLLFGGGENYSSRFPKDIKNFVRPHMLRIYPELKDTRIDYGWGGTLAITLNRMPDFGRVGEHLLYAQGFSGHGVPTATMAGKLLAAAIDNDSQSFDLMGSIPTHRFPGGTLLRWPGLVAGMLFYSLLDKLGR